MSFPAQRRAWRELGKLALATGLATVVGVGGLLPQVVCGKELAAPPGIVARAELPREAQLIDQRIRAGGPFEHARDGAVFGNRERLLPMHPRGYYREYTVPTPRARDRGARRIVCGGREATRPEACYYTDDHYASFRRIVP